MAPHVREVEIGAASAPGPGACRRTLRRDLALPVQVLERIVKRAERDDRDAGDHGGLLGIARGHEQAPHPAPAAVERHRQHAADGLNPPVEGELAQDHRVVDQLPLEDAGGAKDAERHRQVEGRADLAYLGRRQVDGDPLRREVEPNVADGGAHAVAALAHGWIRKPDRRERR